MRNGIDIEDGALCGHDGRIVYSDTITNRLYALLDDKVRRSVRDMIRTSWQGSWDVKPEEMLDATGIASVTIRISDCVARSRIVLGAGLDKSAQVIVDGYEVTIQGQLPETIIASIRRTDLGDLTGVPMLKGLKVSHVRNAANPVVLLWDDMPCHIIDAQGIAEDAARMAAIAA